jgi:hypothetical protein
MPEDEECVCDGYCKVTFLFLLLAMGLLCNQNVRILHGIVYKYRGPFILNHGSIIFRNSWEELRCVFGIVPPPFLSTPPTSRSPHPSYLPQSGIKTLFFALCLRTLIHGSHAVETRQRHGVPWSIIHSLSTMCRPHFVRATAFKNSGA